MKIVIVLISFFLLNWVSAQDQTTTEIDFEGLRETFNVNKIENEAKAGEAILKMAELKSDPKVLPFLLQLYNHPANPNTSFGEKYPDVRDPKGYPSEIAYRGWAHLGLITLGHAPAEEKLLEEILHQDKTVRSVALRKVRMLKDDLSVEALSFFLGDDETGEPFGSLEFMAVEELIERLDDPPYKFTQRNTALEYSQTGKIKWLEWRYKNYGPIPGREELFTLFATSGEQDAPPVLRSKTPPKSSKK